MHLVAQPALPNDVTRKSLLFMNEQQHFHSFNENVKYYCRFLYAVKCLSLSARCTDLEGFDVRNEEYRTQRESQFTGHKPVPILMTLQPAQRTCNIPLRANAVSVPQISHGAAQW
jgi:hypothetical protein